MDEENEILDWEEDEEQTNIVASGPIDDADGVSLGSDSGDEAESAELAPQLETSSVAAQASSSIPFQDANNNSRPGSPKISSPLQRKDSTSSLKSMKPPESTPVASPKSQNRSQRSKSKPLSSIQLMAHGLPPKPVVSAVPFMPSSNSSLTEATAMATRETVKGKSGGSSSKNTTAKSSFDDDDPLPPHWEIRHPRSGGNSVYYYNNRTHESTWIRPSLHPPSRGHRGESPKPSHYRPGDDRDASPDDDYDRRKRYASPDTGYRRSPSPYAKRRPRSISPGLDRDSSRRGRPAQPLSTKDSRHANRDRDFSQANVSPDRHWSPPLLKDVEDSRSRQQRQRMQDHSDEERTRDSYSEREQSMAGNPNYNRRGTRGDREQDLREPQTHSSDHRPRSPPHHVNDQQPSDRSASATATGKRPRPSRFGTPPSEVNVTASDPEEWVPDEFKDPGANVNPSRSQERSATKDPAIESGPPSDSLSETQQSSRLKRAPLPPQSARFREVSRNNKISSNAVDVPAPVQPTQEQVQAPSQPSRMNQPSSMLSRDPPPHQRASKFGPPLSDDSISTASNTASNTRYPNKAPSQSLRDKETNIPETDMRPSPGMHADRESLGGEDESLPRGPRAMGGKEARDSGPLLNRTWKDEIHGSTGGRGRVRGRPPPPPSSHPSASTNAPMGSRIGADGIPNGPARNPAPKLSSANMIPVTNNRYAKANEEHQSRNGTAHNVRSTSGSTEHDRDEHPNHGRASEISTIPPGHRSPGYSYTSPDYRQREPSPPRSQESSMTSPRWERDSDRRPGRFTRGRSLDEDYPSRESYEHERNRPSRGQQVNANGYAPPPSVSLPPPGHGLPPKPMVSMADDYDYERSPKRAPDRSRNRRSTSPGEHRGGGRQRHRRLSDVQFPPVHDRNDIPPPLISKAFNTRRVPDLADVGMDVDDGPLAHNHRDKREPRNSQDRPSARRGGSLLDRLSMNASPIDEPKSTPPTLRDRVQIPAKRDREEMIREEIRGNGIGDVDMEDGSMGGTVRKRKRSGKPRRGRAGGAGAGSAGGMAVGAGGRRSPVRL